MGTAGRDGWDAGLPERVGKYTVLGHLATGGMAEVYLARQQGIEGFEKTVVIKRIRPELTTDRTTVNQFLDEARLVATLEHPNIAQVYEVDVVNGMYFFVMEYVYGADLRQLLRRAERLGRAITLGNALYIVIEICKALHFAHEKRGARGASLGIIHRDVSPSNILISHDGAVKICDFGVAKAADRNAETLRGTLKGKLSYMSPEQCTSTPLDRRSDIFAIGIILYEITTLTRLFRANSDFELMRSIVEDPIPPPSTRVATYSRELERIVMRALARDPAGRWATAQDLQLALEDFAREHKLALSSVDIKRMMQDLFAIGERRDQTPVSADTDVDGKVIDEPLLPFDSEPVSQVVDAEPVTGVVTTPGKARPALPRAASRAGLEQGPATPRPTIPSAPPPAISATPRPAIGPREGPSTSRPPPVAATPRPAIAGTPRRQPVPPEPRGVPWPAATFGMLGVLIAVGAPLVASIDKGPPQATLDELSSSASAIKTVIDACVSTARTRADGIATTPRLRAAIETDAPTIRDLFETELSFSPRAGEVLEVYRLEDGKRTSMLRMPRDAAPVASAHGTAQRLERRGDDLVAVVEVPIANLANQRAGSVAYAATADLAEVRARLARASTKAALVGPALDLELAGGAGAGQRVELPIRGAADLTLVAYATPGAAPAWLVPVRYGGGALALTGGLLFGIGLWRRRSQAT